MAKKATPDVDLAQFNEFTFQGKSFLVKRKFRVGRFLKTLSDSPVDAIELALDEKSYDVFLDLEIDMDDLKEFLELLSQTLAGTSAGN